MLDAIERNVNELAREEAEAAPQIDEAVLPPITAPSRDRLSPAANILPLGPLTIVPGRYQITVADQSVALTPTEFDLLLYLAAHRSRVVSCQELVYEVRGYVTNEAEAREVMRPHVSNLRRKLKSLGDYSQLVVNVRGIGYRLGDLAEDD